MVKLGDLRRREDSFSDAAHILPCILGKENGWAVAVKAPEVISSPPDQVRGQGAARRKSAAYMLVCEHFKEDCNAAIRAWDEVLKQLIGKGPVKPLTNNLTLFPT